MKRLTIGLLLACYLCVSCSSDKKEEKEENVQQLLPETPTEVTVDTLRLRSFSSEIVSNGILASANIAELRFRLAEPIASISVRNGQYVKKGQQLASLSSYAFENKLKQAVNELERTKLELQDILIGQGYKLKDTASIPADVKRLAEVKSGYARALHQYENTLYEKQQTVLKAPISGVVANMKSTKHSIAKPGEVFCNIVDVHKMNVSFSVLENELGAIKKGDKVKITSYAMPDMQMRGKISEINPWVDKNGMVAVKASVNYQPNMIEGMNVKVSIFRSLKKQLVVPKTAVVLRTGKPVIFSYSEGKAQWNYVQTHLENDAEYTITITSGKLKEGGLIISSGNVNLADGSPVTITQK